MLVYTIRLEAFLAHEHHALIDRQQTNKSHIIWQMFAFLFMFYIVLCGRRKKNVFAKLHLADK